LRDAVAAAASATSSQRQTDKKNRQQWRHVQFVASHNRATRMFSRKN
jgi:hypothetical protein